MLHIKTIEGQLQAQDLKITINKKSAAALGITIPEDVLKDADVVE